MSWGRRVVLSQRGWVRTVQYKCLSSNYGVLIMYTERWCRSNTVKVRGTVQQTSNLIRTYVHEDMFTRKKSFELTTDHCFAQSTSSGFSNHSPDLCAKYLLGRILVILLRRVCSRCVLSQTVLSLAQHSRTNRTAGHQPGCRQDCCGLSVLSLVSLS